jgi:hypothetical protein
LEAQGNYERYRFLVEAEKKNVSEIAMLKETQEKILISDEAQKLAPTQKDIERGKQQRYN